MYSLIVSSYPKVHARIFWNEECFILFCFSPLNLGLRQYLQKCFGGKKSKKPLASPFVFPFLSFSSCCFQGCCYLFWDFSGSGGAQVFPPKSNSLLSPAQNRSMNKERNHSFLTGFLTAKIRLLQLSSSIPLVTVVLQVSPPFQFIVIVNFSIQYPDNLSFSLAVLTLPTYKGSVPVYSSRTKNWFQTQLLFVRECDSGLSDRSASNLPGGVGVPERTVVTRSISPQKYKDMASPSQLFALLILPEVHVGLPGFQKVKYRVKPLNLEYFTNNNNKKK